MKKILGIDFESTGLDNTKARIIEIGAVLFEVENCTWTPTKFISRLCWSLGDEALPKEIVEVTGITDAKLQEEGKPLGPCLEELAELAAEAEMLVAHNALYDKGLLESNIKTLGMDLIDKVPNMLQLPWLCSWGDLKQNKKFKCGKLSHLALDYGVPVDPNELHRAYADVMLMGKMLTAAKALPEEMLKYQQSPSYIVAAKIKPPWEDGGKEKDQAVKLGYGWQKARGTDLEIPKSWVKKVKDCDLDEERKLAPFDIKIIQPI